MFSLCNYFNKKAESQNFMSCQVFIRSMWARFKFPVPIPGRKSFTLIFLQSPISRPHSLSILLYLPTLEVWSIYTLPTDPCLWLLTWFGKRKLSQETDSRRTVVSYTSLLVFRGLPKAGPVIWDWPRSSVVTVLVSHSLSTEFSTTAPSFCLSRPQSW